MIPKELADYCEVPFLSGGRSLDGWDCYGLCWYVAGKHFNRHYPSMSGTYDIELDYSEIGTLVDNEKQSRWSNIESGQEVPGDVILLRMRGLPIHVGLVVDKNTMMHVRKGQGTILENYSSFLWNKRILGFWRYDS